MYQNGVRANYNTNYSDLSYAPVRPSNYSSVFHTEKNVHRHSRSRKLLIRQQTYVDNKSMGLHCDSTLTLNDSFATNGAE